MRHRDAFALMVEILTAEIVWRLDYRRTV